MPKRDVAYMANQKRTIGQACLKLMEEVGFHQVSIRDICVAAGISKGAFHVHFKHKSDVIESVLELHLANLNAFFSFESWKDAEAQCRHWLVQAALPQSRQEQALGHEIAAEAIKQPNEYPAFGRLYFEMLDHLTDVLRTEDRRGAIRLPTDPRAAAQGILALLEGARKLLLITLPGSEKELIDNSMKQARLIVGAKPPPA